MNINEVWELLETEPTSDKKAIKQAYARAVKKYHPEENPQEFQKVYAAYKQAMAMAGKTGGGQTADVSNLISQTLMQGQFRQGTLQEAEEKGREQESLEEGQETAFRGGEEEQIQKMFREMAERREKKLSVFRQKWLWYLKNQRRDDAEKEMRKYIQSSWFKDIMEEPEVLSRLATGIDSYCQDNGEILKEEIWQLYLQNKSFGDEDKKGYQTLFRVLEADRKRLSIRKQQEAEIRRRMVQSQMDSRNLSWQRARKSGWQGRMTSVGYQMYILLIASIVLIPILFLTIDSNRSALNGNVRREREEDQGFSREREKEEILSYLQEIYPMAEFSQPELSTEESWGQYVGEEENGRNYTIKVADSDITVHAYAFYKNGYISIGEDFGKQYMRQLAKERGIMCDLCHVEEPWDDGKSHYLMLGYYHMGSELKKLEEELDGFMEKFYAFAQSEEVGEFANIEGVSFSLSNCFCPTAFIMGAGGVPEPLLYDPKELPQPEVMAEDMAECILGYYIHMEPWQLEDDPLYEEWISGYENRARDLTLAPETSSGEKVTELAGELGVQILVYRYEGFDCISLGDAYRMAEKAGLPVSETEDGGGFVLQKDGYEITCSYENMGGRIICEKVLEMFAEE